jgi:hypothetical protein
MQDEFDKEIHSSIPMGSEMCTKNWLWVLYDQFFSSLTKSRLLLLTYQKVLAQMTMYIVGLIYTCGISSQEYKLI